MVKRLKFRPIKLKFLENPLVTVLPAALPRRNWTASVRRQLRPALRGQIDAGNVDMARVDEAVGRILTTKFELGLFERTHADRTDIADVGSGAHRAVARQAVRESLVLLQNSNNVLPVDLTR